MSSDPITVHYHFHFHAPLRPTRPHSATAPVDKPPKTPLDERVRALFLRFPSHWFVVREVTRYFFKECTVNVRAVAEQLCADGFLVARTNGRRYEYRLAMQGYANVDNQ